MGIIDAIAEDASWLFVEPLSGIIFPFTSNNYDVLVDASDLSVGTYSTDIRVYSNDPVNPLIRIPVNLTVIENDPAHYYHVSVPARTDVSSGTVVVMPVTGGRVHTNAITSLISMLRQMAHLLRQTVS
jgi:hypothetical protein